MTVQAPANSPPVITSSGSASVTAGASGHFYTATATDDDAGDVLTFLSLAGADANRFSFNTSTGQLSLASGTPAGVYSVTLRVTDTKTTVTEPLSVTVQAPANQAPEPVDDWVFSLSGAVRTVNVLGNDTDPDGDTLYVDSVSSGSAGGTAEVVGSQIHFIPATARNETFTYTVRDRSTGGLQGTATIHATVNRHPDLQSETYTLSPGESDTLDVLSNDSDPDTQFGGHPLIIYAVTGVSGGASATPSADGRSVAYTAPNAPGSYYFTYWVKDQSGGVSSIRSYVTVVAPNQSPITSPDYFSLLPGETQILYGILSNDSDPDDDPLTIERVYEFQGGGSGSVNADRTSVTYTAPLTPGSARFAYVAIDGRGGFRFNWVNITVLPSIDDCGGVLCLPEP